MNGSLSSSARRSTSGNCPLSMVACSTTVRPFRPGVWRMPPFALIGVLASRASTSCRVVSPLVPSTSATNVVDSGKGVPPMSRLKSGVVVGP